MANPGFDRLLERGAVGLLILAATWILLILIAVLVEARTDGRIALSAGLGCPRRVRALLLALLATLSVAAPASAHEALDPGTRSLDGLAVPDRFSQRVEVSAVPREQVGTPVSSWVTVRPGDSLWSLVRQRLPPGASSASVAAVTHALYVQNRSVIGADPDRIQPGQHLTFPSRSTISEHMTYSEDS